MTLSIAGRRFRERETEDSLIIYRLNDQEKREGQLRKFRVCDFSTKVLKYFDWGREEVSLERLMFKFFENDSIFLFDFPKPF